MAARILTSPEHDAIVALIRGLHAEREAMPSSQRTDTDLDALFEALAAVDACRWALHRTDRHLSIIDRWAPGRGLLIEREIRIVSGQEPSRLDVQALQDDVTARNRRNARDRAAQLRAALDTKADGKVAAR